jgi:hypothetical protein
MSVGTLTLTCLLLIAGQSADEVIPLNQRKLHFPISVKPERRQEISQFTLYVSSDHGRTWQQNTSVPSDKDEFIFYAPDDGEYWLRVATINRAGKQEPENIYAERSPPQKILIDTKRPIIRISSAVRKGDAVEVNWEIQEEHPDLASLRLEYRTPDTPAGAWEQTPITPGLVGQGRIRPASPKAMEVRVQMKDTAENHSVATVKIAAESGVTVAGFTSNHPTAPPVPPSPEVPAAPPTPALPAQPPAGPEPARQTVIMPAATSTVAAPPVAPPASRLASNADSLPTPAASTEMSASVPAPRPLPEVKYVNSKELTLEYELDRVGPSGVGKVVLWLTEDDGQTWHDWADDPEVEKVVQGSKYKRSIVLPREGLFGFRLQVMNRVSLGSPKPQPGDPPEMRVEVDLTAPTAKLYCQPDPQHENALLLRWECEDKNLLPECATLDWADSPRGPWHLIQSSLPAIGSHSWRLTSEAHIPVYVYLRLRVRDAAGNEAAAVTQQPQLTDLTRPLGHLCGVSVTPQQ